MPTFSSSKLNNRIVKKLIILFLLGVVLGTLGQAQTPIRVASYNVENYILSPIQNRPLKTKLAQAKVVESILAAKPDVLALQEVGTIKALAKLQKDGFATARLFCSRTRGANSRATAAPRGE